jgi:hypothetical protein
MLRFGGEQIKNRRDGRSRTAMSGGISSCSSSNRGGRRSGDPPGRNGDPVLAARPACRPMWRRVVPCSASRHEAAPIGWRWMADRCREHCCWFPGYAGNVGLDGFLLISVWLKAVKANRGRWVPRPPPVRLAPGQRGEGRSVVDRKLLIDTVQVDLDRALGNVELASDILVRPSFGNQMYDLAFTVGQRGRQFLKVASPAGFRAAR